MSETLSEVYKSYANTAGELEGREWTKMLRESGVFTKEFTSGEGDIVFAKVKAKDSFRINYKSFQEALVLVAKKTGVSLEQLSLRLVKCPSMADKKPPTPKGPERFFYDKNSYTGSHATADPKDNASHQPSYTAELDWSSSMQNLQAVFASYVGHLDELEGRDWTRLLKSSGLIGDTLSSGEADIIFSKVKPKTSFRLDFSAFVNALSIVCQKLKLSPEQLSANLVKHTAAAHAESSAKGPERFFYDKNSYTGANAVKDSALPAPKVVTPKVDWASHLTKLKEIFAAYAASSGELEGRDWSRLLKVSGLFTAEFTSGEGDIVFSKVKPKSSFRIDFNAFQEALGFVAKKLHLEPAEVVAKLAIPEAVKDKDGSKLKGPERFFYDKTTYTGAKSEKVTGDDSQGTVNLANLLDRSPYDVRGRKITTPKK